MAVRVLVVDDDPGKLAHLTKLLVEVGLGVDDIQVAQTGSDARRALTETVFDLLILDIALPMRAGDTPDRRGGLKLLQEVLDRQIFKLPQSVFGLTGFEELYDELAGYFHSQAWTLDYYSSSDQSWSDRLRAKANYIIARSTQCDRPRFETDLCVITALHSPELAALRRMDWNWSSAISLDEIGYYYEGKISLDGDKKISVIASAAPRMGMVSSAILSTSMIVKFRPRMLAMIGICAGVKGHCQIGDVLIADPSWDWQMGKILSNGTFQIGPDQIGVETAVTQRFVQLADDKALWLGMYENFPGKKPDNLPTARVGPVACSSAVIADAELLHEIRDGQHRKLLGLEMELYGMYAAARDSSRPKPIAFGIKSVCDYADSKKSDDFQNYSAHVSAGTLAAFCQKYGADFLA
jgi:nucleoside phosphorylase/CheY-like chemotaxis protein